MTEAATVIMRDDTIHPPYFQFPKLCQFPGLFHGVFTRQGGVSTEPFNTLNIGSSVGDRPDHVRENRRRIMLACGEVKPFFLSQVHGTDVCRISSSLVNDDATGIAPKKPLEADALITNELGVCLCIQVADCQAIILYDPIRQAIGNVHSGWRGSIENIAGKTVGALLSAYGSNPADIYAAISPSLGPCCAEFVHYRIEIPCSFWRYKNTSDHFDFWAITRDQLLGVGVPESHIFTSNICTKCRKDMFFSYRDAKNTGRFAVMAALVKK